MSDDLTTPEQEILSYTSEVVSAYLANNAVAASDVPDLIRTVHRTFSKLQDGAQSTDRPEPAVAIKKSIMPDYIICLEDGKKLKMLKRHLNTSYGMSPEVYRERWGLPADYPMVAPNYAKRRSALAKKIGLGTKEAGTKEAGNKAVKKTSRNKRRS